MKTSDKVTDSNSIDTAVIGMARRGRATLGWARRGGARPCLALLVLALLMIFSGDATAAVTCRDSSGGGGKHWMWREIDSKKCWYVGDELLPKSELTWAVSPEQQTKERARPAPLPRPDPPPPPVIEEVQDQPPSRPTVPPLPPRILRVQVVHEGMDNRSNWIDGKGRPIDLMQRGELQSTGGVGGHLVIPPYYNRAARMFNELEK